MENKEKKIYKSPFISVYFANSDEKKVVFQYAIKYRGFKTFKDYLDDLFFKQEAVNELLTIKRNARSSNHTKMWSQNKYTYNLLVEEKQYIQKLAEENNMSATLYVLSRIKTDMISHGYNFPDHFSRYIVFYKDADSQERSIHTDDIDDAMEKIQKEREKGSQDIMLIDALRGSRTFY